jgi:hypothetical protein
MRIEEEDAPESRRLLDSASTVVRLPGIGKVIESLLMRARTWSRDRCTPADARAEVCRLYSERPSCMARPLLCAPSIAVCQCRRLHQSPPSLLLVFPRFSDGIEGLSAVSPHHLHCSRLLPARPHPNREHGRRMLRPDQTQCDRPVRRRRDPNPLCTPSVTEPLLGRILSRRSPRSRCSTTNYYSLLRACRRETRIAGTTRL